MNTSNNFTTFYTPVPGKYIVVSKHDWYDYDTVKFGKQLKNGKGSFK